MSLRKTEAVVLRRRSFRDTSLIFTLFTKDKGKIEALAKGIKKNISRGEGGMEVFSQVEIIYYEREPRTLRLLSHMYLLDSFRTLRNNLVKFVSASYLVELIDCLIHGEERNENIYYLILDSLHSLEGKQDIDRLIHFFEIKLIRLLGYGISSRAQRYAPGITSILQFLENADFNSLSRLKISRKDGFELKKIIQNYINALPEIKPLRSIDVLRKMNW